MTITASDIELQITSDITACQTLVELLSNEQEALKKQDSDALSRIIEAKIAPLQHLEESAKIRATWIEASSAEKASENWDQLLSELKSTKLKADWETLKKLTQQCRDKNEVNGKLLIRNQQVFGRLLEIMRGQSAGPTLYNATGASSSGNQSHKVGEA